MHAQIKRAGDEWTLRQDSTATAGVAAATLVEAREWPLLIAASGKQELTALKEIHEKHDYAAHLDCLAPGTRTLRVSNRVFKLLSRQGARYQELLSKHQRCPFLIFNLLNDPADTVAKLKKACGPSLDEYTKGFLSFHGGVEKCNSGDARAELLLIAILV